ncbi:hypothetical protein BK010_09115 [Tenericutes bacterium MO-XQ]|nr:hypothetical protein BK010_09115 [Tenericutes bacterium MO-XQ]
MESLFETLKLKDKTFKHKTLRYQWIMIVFMIFLGIVLIVIDQDQLLTPGVLIIIFSFILLIITLFMTALNVSKSMNLKIKNSIDIVYQNYADQHNLNQKTTYQYQTEDFNLNPWHLVPSYSNIDVDYELKDDQIQMFHAESYNVFGEKRTRTYYFKGLYIITPYPYQDFVYKDKKGISDSIIHALKDIHKKDEHDTKTYPYQKKLLEGNLSSQSELNPPSFFDDLYQFIHTYPFVSSVDIAVIDNNLEIAIATKNIRLPYVKKYTDNELADIKKIVDEDIKMLEEIKEMII